MQYFIERGSPSNLEKGERETKRESVIGGGVQSQEQVYMSSDFSHVRPPSIPPPPSRGLDPLCTAARARGTAVIMADRYDQAGR